MTEALERARNFHRQGRYDEAEAVYQELLAQDPANPDALHLLGVLSEQRGRREAAIDLMQRSIVWNPTIAYYHSNLGETFRKAGRLDEAIGCFRRAVELKRDDSGAHYNLGLAYSAASRREEAIGAYRRALAFNSNFIQALTSLGVELGRSGAYEEAETCLRRAVELGPATAAAHLSLGELLVQAGNPSEAIKVFQRAQVLMPDDANVHLSLGMAYVAIGRPDEAIESYQRALAIDPSHLRARTNLAKAHFDRAEPEQGIAMLRECAAQRSRSAVFSNLLSFLWRSPRESYTEIMDEHRRWRDAFVAPLESPRPSHDAVDAAPDRGLRVGYVSPDFRQHPVGAHIAAVLANHEREAFTVVCYSDVTRPDSLTTRVRERADSWVDIVRISDEELAERVRQDRIDILIDCSQHLANNRLLTFARKPAPVQIGYFGYPAPTGVDVIDYRISDRHLDPDDLGAWEDPMMGEQVLRLGDSFWCYTPHPLTPEVEAPPANETGSICFGSLSNPGKLNAATLALWARVLAACENARLMLLGPGGQFEERVARIMREHGVKPERVRVLTRLSPEKYLRQYLEFDIVLDPYPFNGHMTTLDALYMGRPVISLAGETPVSRAGLSILSQVDLADLVASSGDQFVEIAAKLAGDRQRLSHLRRHLRGTMQFSPLMDAHRLTSNVEALYRSAWRKFCESVVTLTF